MCEYVDGKFGGFNQDYPVGSTVTYTSVNGAVVTTRVRRPAKMLGDKAVVWLEGINLNLFCALSQVNQQLTTHTKPGYGRWTELRP